MTEAVTPSGAIDWPTRVRAASILVLPTTRAAEAEDAEPPAPTLVFVEPT